MREVIQIIKCDNCKSVVESESMLTTHVFVWDKEERLIEWCDACESQIIETTLDQLFNMGVKVPKSKRRKGTTVRSDIKSGFDEYWVDDLGKYMCPFPECGRVFGKANGLQVHHSRTHGSLLDH